MCPAPLPHRTCASTHRLFFESESHNTYTRPQEPIPPSLLILPRSRAEQRIPVARGHKQGWECDSLLQLQGSASPWWPQEEAAALSDEKKISREPRFPHPQPSLRVCDVHRQPEGPLTPGSSAAYTLALLMGQVPYSDPAQSLLALVSISCRGLMIQSSSFQQASRADPFMGVSKTIGKHRYYCS